MPAWNRFLLLEVSAPCGPTRDHEVVFSASQVEYSAGLLEVKDGLRSKVKVSLTCAVQMQLYEIVSYTLALCSALFSGQRCKVAGSFWSRPHTSSSLLRYVICLCARLLHQNATEPRLAALPLSEQGSLNQCPGPKSAQVTSFTPA